MKKHIKHLTIIALAVITVILSFEIFLNSNLHKSIATEVYTRNVMEELSISESEDIDTQIQNILKVHAYIVNSFNYDYNHLEEIATYGAENYYLYQLYYAFTTKDVNCTTEAVIMEHLLEKINIDCEVLLLNGKTMNHAIPIVLIGDKYYAFDTGADRMLIPLVGKGIYKAVGIGRDKIEETYVMNGILPDDMTQTGEFPPVPSNLSKENLDLTKYLNQ